MKNSLVFGIVFLAALAGASAFTYGQTTYVSGYGPSYVDYYGYNNYNPYTNYQGYQRSAYTCIGSGCSGIYGQSRLVTYTYRGQPAYPGTGDMYYGSYGYAGYNPSSYYYNQGYGYYPMLYTYGYDSPNYQPGYNNYGYY